jgi:hypothetical protein
VRIFIFPSRHFTFETSTGTPGCEYGITRSKCVGAGKGKVWFGLLFQACGPGYGDGNTRGRVSQFSDLRFQIPEKSPSPRPLP